MLTDILASDVWDLCKISARMASAPFHAQKRELLEALGLATAVALSSTLDNSVRDGMNDLDEPWADVVSDIGYLYQDEYVTLGTASLFYACGAIQGNSKIRRIGMEIIEAHGIAAAGCGLLKSLAGRDRPGMEHGSYHFVGPNLHDRHQSFPSGDAMKAFTLSSVLSAEAKSIPVTILLYSLATTTAFQRLHADRHWLSDTIGSAVWGTTVGLGVVYLNHRSSRISGKSSSLSDRYCIHILPMNPASSVAGIGFTLSL
jgi:hypothetical protein